jgi:putative membrane protein
MSQTLQGLVVACVVAALAATTWAEDKDRAAKDKSKENRGTLDAATFVQMAASANLHELEMGKLGSKRATATEVREFAQKMVKDHATAMEKLKKAAKAAKVDLPSKQSKEDEKACALIEKHEGKDFDAVFMRQMVEGHQRALALHERAVKEVMNADVRKYAEDAVPVIRGHLKSARKVSDMLGGKGKAEEKGRKDH